MSASELRRGVLKKKVVKFSFPYIFSPLNKNQTNIIRQISIAWKPKFNHGKKVSIELEKNNLIFI